MMLLAATLYSCGRLGENVAGTAGRLRVSFIKGTEKLTKAYLNLPDTTEFLLKITDGSGTVVFEGKYGDCPEEIEVTPGTYNIRVVSSEFTKPSFDAPQFGDEQCVTVQSGGTVSAVLECVQLNAGVRLKIDSSFLTECPDAVLFLKSSQGKLMYSYTEKRTAYFSAGQVSLVMNSESDGDQTLMVRNLNPSEMLVLGVSALASQSQAEGLSVSIDTSRVWINDECIIGADSSAGLSDNPLSIAEAMSSVGDEDVWVCGYIVGGDLTSSSASFEEPFKSRTNIVLGPRSSTEDKDACLSVQLPDTDVREAINLVDNPQMLGTRVCLKGDIVESYFGIVGVKNVSEYKIL